MNKDISKEVQQVVDIICQYAPENWDAMGTNFFPQTNGIDAYTTVNEDEYSIGFDEEDTAKLISLFQKIVKIKGNVYNSISFEVDNEGNYEINFEN